MKKLTLLITISVFSQNGFSETRPDYGKIAIEGMVEGMKSPFRNMPKAIEIIGNEFIGSTPKTKRWKKTVTCNKEGKKCKTSYSD